MTLAFAHPRFQQELIFSAEVVQHLKKHQQRNGPEVGGQLFGVFSDGKVIVSKATGPRAQDKKSRFLFIPCRLTEQREINRMFKAGLHYLGDWHTHPEPYPHPSPLDLKSMRDCFVKSKHKNDGFVMAIAGNAPEGWLWVSVHDGRGFLQLNPKVVAAVEDED